MGGDFVGRITSCLTDWTGQHWHFQIVRDQGGETLAEIETRREQSKLAEAREHPKIKGVFEHFPDARLVKVTDRSEDDAGWMGAGEADPGGDAVPGPGTEEEDR